MQYHEFNLTEPLKSYIQTIWAMESENEKDIYPRSLIMPDGIVEIIFHYETPLYTWQDNTRFLQPQSFAISMMKKYVEIASSGKTGFISVRFYPWGAYQFFDYPISEFLDQTIDTSQLWDDSKVIVQHLKRPGTIDGRFRLVEQYLADKLKKFQKKEDKTGDAIKLIRQTKGILSIEEICAQTNIAKKQLERKFLSSVGTTPKIFSRITRFLNICHHLEEHKGKTLTQLTHDCGYYDQAHFIKEFKEFSGFTPKEFFDKENVYFSEI